MKKNKGQAAPTVKAAKAEISRGKAAADARGASPSLAAAQGWLGDRYIGTHTPEEPEATETAGSTGDSW
ncbi:hypothetical protein AB0J21_28905 [Streptomyces sp. NPDC049954]|uniref:hypothetical protein n=1 Tax=Streptomyces sp. NPDC049954 TaxID=3155779 RepID=UPI00341DE871